MGQNKRTLSTKYESKKHLSTTNNNHELHCYVLQKGRRRQTSQLQKVCSQSRQKRIYNHHVWKHQGSQAREEVRVLVLLARPLRRGDLQAGSTLLVSASSQEEADTNQLFFAGPALYENRY